MYGPFPQSVEPSHRRGPEAGREYLTHQIVISGVQGHHLHIVAHMFHRVGFTIVASKRQSVETSRHLDVLYIIKEG